MPDLGEQQYRKYKMTDFVRTVEVRPKHRKQSEDPDFFVEKKLATKLAVSVGVLRKWRANGTGPIFCRMNGCIRYPRDGVQQFIEDSKCRFTSEASNSNRAISAQPVNWKG